MKLKEITKEMFDSQNLQWQDCKVYPNGTYRTVFASDNGTFIKDENGDDFVAVHYYKVTY